MVRNKYATIYELKPYSVLAVFFNKRLCDISTPDDNLL